MRILSNYSKVAQVDPVASLEEIAAEPKLNSLLWEDAKAQAGPLASMCFELIDELCLVVPRGMHPVVDTRVHRLMPRMYPAIPGWHCDDVPRSPHTGQPDYSLHNSEAYHLAVFIDNASEVSCTEFLEYGEGFDFIEPGTHVWRTMHSDIEKLELCTIQPSPGAVVRFNGYTPHRATPAIGRGWRFWLRLSMMHKPALRAPVEGPEQAYVISEENGW